MDGNEQLLLGIQNPATFRTQNIYPDGSSLLFTLPVASILIENTKKCHQGNSSLYHQPIGIKREFLIWRITIVW